MAPIITEPPILNTAPGYLITKAYSHMQDFLYIASLQARGIPIMEYRDPLPIDSMI